MLISVLDESIDAFVSLRRCFRELEDIIFSLFFLREKDVWVMTMPDDCKGLRGVEILNEYFGAFSQVVVNRLHGLFSEWICTFVSL